jgi:hypothetical protein
MALAVSVEPNTERRPMQKIVELKIEETKAVVGGTKIATPSAPVVVSSNPGYKLPSPTKPMTIADLG